MSAYRGRVYGARQNYGWINISSVTKADGSPHDLDTTSDIYLHRGNSPEGIWENMEVEFAVTQDQKRGRGTYRALHARVTAQGALDKLRNRDLELNLQGMGSTRTLESSSVFATWCLSPKAAARIKEIRLNDGLHTRLLLVWWPVGRRTTKTEQRKLVELTDPMAAITFETSGQHRVLALLVSGEREHSLEARYLMRERGKFHTDIVSTDEVRLVRGEQYIGHDCVEADVPEELFARKPFDWEWVNYFFKEAPRDQCAYRRRRLFAYSVQPPLFVLLAALIGAWGALRWTLTLVLILGGLSIGLRNLNYEGLRHPLSRELFEVYVDIEGNFFIPKIKNKFVFLPLAVSPLALIAAAGAATIRGHSVGSEPWLLSVATLLLVLVVVMAVFTVIALWYQSVDWAAVDKEREHEERARLAREVDELICLTTGPRKADVWALPLNRKTFRFYAAAMKQKVCKGFAA